MKTLVIGSGGREHALVKALKGSKIVNEVFAYPGSAAIFLEAQKLTEESLDLTPENFPKFLSLAVDNQIELVVVGPEAPLVEGFADHFRENGILVFGPNKEAAQLEGDKLFAKDFMDEFQIPTGSYKKVSDPASLEEALREYKDHPFYVFKYRDLAGGKGVLVSSSADEVRDFAKKFGVRPEQTQTVAYLEEPLEGWELSCIALVHESGCEICPILQDHKRLLEKDQGPNTGGMGVAGPLKLDEKLESEIYAKIIEPTLEGLRSREMVYRGALYFGIMVTQEGPKVLEYNVRFGDPEAQLIFPLVNSDWGEVFYKISLGQEVVLTHSENFGACVVLTAKGYPESPQKGDLITGLEELKASEVCHAATDFKEQWQTNGGRVLNVIAQGASLEEALETAYHSVDKIDFSGKHFRRDIGQKLL